METALPGHRGAVVTRTRGGTLEEDCAIYMIAGKLGEGPECLQSHPETFVATEMGNINNTFLQERMGQFSEAISSFGEV